MLDQISMSFLRELRAEWRHYPPLRAIGSALAGYKPPPDIKATETKSNQNIGAIPLAQLQALFPTG